MALSDNLRMMRKKQFLTQEALANELEVTISTVNRWETGKSSPNLSTMKKIKDYCANNNVNYEPIEQSWLETRKFNQGK